MKPEGFLQELIKEITDSRKYCDVNPDLVRMIAENELKKTKTPKKAVLVKSVRTLLHQAGAVFINQEIKKNSCFSHMPEKDELSGLMKMHISTAERLGYAEEFYLFLNRVIQNCASVSDIGCGLNLAGLLSYGFKNITYHGYEVMQELCPLLKNLLHISQTEGDIFSRNILTDPPEKSEAYLMLKLLPALEQISRPQTKHFFENLPASLFIVSYPAGSISGKKKGMKQFYQNWFLEHYMSDRLTLKETMDFPGELVFVIEKN